MQKKIIILLFFFFSCNQSGKNNKIEYYAYPIKKSEGLMKNNLKEGVWKYYFRNGKISSSVTYSGGMVDGEVKVYNEKGNLVTIGFLKNDNYFGIVKNYYPSGILNTLEFYNSNGITEDSFKIWFESGKISQLGKYSNGIVVGRSVLFYENQNHKEIRHYDSLGRKDSVWTYYNVSGIVDKIEKYEQDSLVSTAQIDGTNNSK